MRNYCLFCLCMRLMRIKIFTMRISAYADHPHEPHGSATAWPSLILINITIMTIKICNHLWRCMPCTCPWDRPPSCGLHTPAISFRLVTLDRKVAALSIALWYEKTLASLHRFLSALNASCGTVERFFKFLIILLICCRSSPC